MIVDRATILEQPQIEAMRAAYFEGRGQEVQRRYDATWYVARVGESVKGCYATQDAPGQLWLVDLYRAPGRIGTIAVARMLEHLLAGIDDRELLGMCDPGNLPMLKAYLRRNCEPVAVVLRWKRNAASVTYPDRDNRRSRIERG